jgi:hypothetical protein
VLRVPELRLHQRLLVGAHAPRRVRRRRGGRRGGRPAGGGGPPCGRDRPRRPRRGHAGVRAAGRVARRCGGRQRAGGRASGRGGMGGGRRRAARGEVAGHRACAARVAASDHARRARRLPPERGGERTGRAAPVPRRLRHLGHVPHRPSRARRGAGLLVAHHRHPRRGPLPGGHRRAGRGGGRAAAVGHLRVRASGRHHALEVRQARAEPGQRHRGGVRPACPAGRDRRAGQGRRSGLPAGRGHRRCLRGGGPGPPGRAAQPAAHRRAAAGRRVVMAEPAPGHRFDRDRLPQRRDRPARPATGFGDGESGDPWHDWRT